MFYGPSRFFSIGMCRFNHTRRNCFVEMFDPRLSRAICVLVFCGSYHTEVSLPCSFSCSNQSVSMNITSLNLTTYTYIMFLANICRFGPLSRLWCMRFEAKHKYFKQLCRRSSYKNFYKTLSEKHQRHMAYVLKCEDHFARHQVEIGAGNILIECKCDLYFLNLVILICLVVLVLVGTIVSLAELTYGSPLLQLVSSQTPLVSLCRYMICNSFAQAYYYNLSTV